MDRWKILTLFMTIFVFAGHPVQAQDTKRVILMETMPVPVVLEHSRWFAFHFQKLGYEPGDNLILEKLQPNGDRIKAEHMLSEVLAQGPPDLVVTSATLATQTAVKFLRGSETPVIFMTVSDPVGAGIIKKVGKPTRSNITGKVHMISRESRINLVVKLTREAVKGEPVRIGCIYSAYPSAIGDKRELGVLADKRRDVEFLFHEIPYREVPHGLPQMFDDVRKAVKAIGDKVDYWWELSGPLGETDEFTTILVNESSVPVIMGLTAGSVKNGALLHLSPGVEATGKEAAMLADAVLKGADPGKIPVTPPSSFDLGINLSTAMKNNILIPADILELAGDNIYR